MSTPLEHRYDFVYFFDVTDGNPNGDPDAGNLPRIDPETNQGLVTDVCLKRKIRNYVAETHSEGPGHRIYIREKAVLNSEHNEAYVAVGLKSEKKALPKAEADAKRVTDWMCANFFDIRTFGAVMTTEVNAGQVRGPLQLTFSRSIDPVITAEFAITRCAVTNEKDVEKERTIGRKFNVPYGLYRCYGFINATLAGKTGFGEDDLALLRDALNNMFETDRSAARGMMAPVRCIAFKHESKTGNARADQLFSLVDATLKPELKSEQRPPRSRADYDITLAGPAPEGVTVEEWV
ncbi:CRISPR-associated protein, Csd2 family [Granulicella rosea]|uniref:CRISPR-associated protein, Csd2 family n=1 Tax=Granulicella rosea TaxID=474952 RepID=A0A239K4H7_9BACT|nr:type I-C CRISPR-associated protein Cas7/Csd2 [Granulicella rosea]SNT13326.1 CRISPR-associated protein, Csd2 family [Granulicella rosea]